MPNSTSGAVWGSVSCPKTLRHADQGNQTSDLLITRHWLCPQHSVAENLTIWNLGPFGQVSNDTLSRQHSAEEENCWTQTVNIVEQWSETFAGLLNLTHTSSVKKVVSEYWGEVWPISLAEITEIVKKLLSGKAPGRDEIYPEMLKAPDIIGLSWLACLFGAQWKLGAVPGVADRGDGSHFQKEGPDSVLQLSEYHTAGTTWDSLFSQTGSQGAAMVRRAVWFGNLRITVVVFLYVFIPSDFALGPERRPQSLCTSEDRRSLSRDSTAPWPVSHWQHPVCRIPSI